MSTKGDDDGDDVTAQGQRPRPPEVPDRPTMPQLGRRGARDTDQHDDGPTMFDPMVPTGARFVQTGDDEPTGAKAPLATVIGKRTPKPTAKGTPKMARVDARELPTHRHLPKMKADGTGPVDESSRTAKWDAPALELPLRDSGPPTNPLPRSGPQLPLAPGPQSAPVLRAVSMKTPGEVDAEEKAHRVLPQVRIRAMSEVNNQTPVQGMGYLAPPRDTNQARSRRVQDYVIWGSVAVIVAAVVMLVVWFVAR